jgi:hypothetical protein
MRQEDRIMLLKDEYVMLQQFYEDVDRRCLTIKGWGVTVATASIGAGLVYSRHLFVGALAAALLFWYLEAFYRGLTYFFAQRIKKIEKVIRNEVWETVAPLQVYSTWVAAWDEHKEQTWHYLFRSACRMPHLFTAIASAILYVLYLFGIDFGKPLGQAAKAVAGVE